MDALFTVSSRFLGSSQLGERGAGTASLDQARQNSVCLLAHRPGAIALRSTGCGSQGTPHPTGCATNWLIKVAAAEKRFSPAILIFSLSCQPARYASREEQRGNGESVLFPWYNTSTARTSWLNDSHCKQTWTMVFKSEQRPGVPKQTTAHARSPLCTLHRTNQEGDAVGLVECYWFPQTKHD